MNMTERIPGLHRRAGRRKSTPASPSPSSPTFHRKHGRSQDIAFFSPIEPTSASTPIDSPSIDLDVPSPTFDLTSISPAFASEDNANVEKPARPQLASRASDDLGKTRPRFLAETTRSATTTAEDITNAAHNARTYSPNAVAPQDAPLTGAQRMFGEAPRRSTSREQDDASAQRAVAFWTQYGNTNEEAAGPRGLVNSKRSRFNLLNPMSLLARRRSSQNVNKLDEVNLNVNTLHVPDIPDNITPSIRGTIVHDFSAPRSRRSNNENSPRPGYGPSPSYPRRPSEMASPQIEVSTGTPSSLHSPMFKEHFQEEQRSVQPTNTAYLHGLNLQAPSGGTLPSFAKNLPLSLPDDGQIAPRTEQPSIYATSSPQQHEHIPPAPSQSPPPPPAKKITPQVLEVPPVHALPKHMTSTSSRFSFIGQQGSIAQEKFLEDKHKEQASKQPAPVRFSVASVDDMDDYDDFDGFDDDDGFDNDEVTIRNIDAPSSTKPVQQDATNDGEEDYGFDDGGDDYGDDDDAFGTDDIVVGNIEMPTSHNRYLEGQDNSGKEDVPLGNIDVPTYDSYGEPDESHNDKRQSLRAFHFTPQSLSFSPSTLQHTSQSTPRDVEGFAIGMADYKGGAALGNQARTRDSGDQSLESFLYDGLGISTQHEPLHISGHAQSDQEPFDDDDLYFDDGEFAGDILGPSTNFDEETLDDASQIKDIPAENARKYEEAVERGAHGAEIKATSGLNGDMSEGNIPKPLCLRIEPLQSSLKHPPPQAGLTEGNLAAHHDALTTALNRAAAKSNVDRTVSFTHLCDDETDSPFHNSMPEISSRSSRYSNNMVTSGISDDDGFGLDDDMDDEAMIAAANAEALENDDDGIYGQEFGFFARAYGRDSAELMNGGYFASRGSNGIKRSHSGKNNFQEPSLTPITERSEWSTRNSVASLPLHGGFSGFGQSLPSPGIAQLLERDSLLAEDEMSLSALMRLRGRTFGGSSSSINSLADRHQAHSSPLAHISGHNSSHNDAYTGRMSSSIPMGTAGIAESEDEDDEGGKQTLTQTHRIRSTWSRLEKLPGRLVSKTTRLALQSPARVITAGIAVALKVLAMHETTTADGCWKGAGLATMASSKSLVANMCLERVYD